MIRKDIKNKADMVQFIKEQINVELVNDKKNSLNNKRNTLYTEIPRDRKTLVMSFLYKHNIRCVDHHKDNYWIFIK